MSFGSEHNLGLAVPINRLVNRKYKKIEMWSPRGKCRDIGAYKRSLDIEDSGLYSEYLSRYKHCREVPKTQLLLAGLLVRYYSLQM
jgi:hypothetical protein